jgi:hypothetical protein
MLEFESGVGLTAEQNRLSRAGPWIRLDTLGRFPIDWNHLIKNELVKSKKLEQALDEKVGQLP